MSKYNKLFKDIVERQRYNGEINIGKWRMAQTQAYSIDRPRRNTLYAIYDQIVDDTHLCSEIEKRILNVLGSPFQLVDVKTGEPNEELTDLLKRPWFYKAVKLAMEAKLYGHSLIQLGDMLDGEIQDVELIPRPHVIPEKGIILKELSDEIGVPYRDEPKIYDWLLEVGDPKDLGLLNKCVPHALYKRFAMGSYSEYSELFVTPLRVGKTNASDDESLDKMEEMLVNMSVAAYAVIDEDESIEFVESTNNQGSQTFEKLIAGCNNEMTKCINRAVIGQESQGGSRAKEEVGERIMESGTKADLTFISNLVNFDWNPKLIQKGYSFTGYKFQYEKPKNVKELLEVTKTLLPYKNIPNDWIQENLGVVVEDKQQMSDEEFEQRLSKTLQNKGLDFFV